MIDDSKMSMEEIIKEITEETHWGLKKVKEKYVRELLEMAQEEGTEWGETLEPICECYLQVNYASDDFMNAFYKEIAQEYLNMVEQTQIVEYPEEERIIKVPARKIREWY